MGIRKDVENIEHYIIHQTYDVLLTHYVKEILPRDSFYITEFLKRVRLTNPEFVKKLDYNGIGIRWKGDTVEFQIIKNGKAKDIETVPELVKVIESFNEFISNLLYKTTGVKKIIGGEEQ